MDAPVRTAQIAATILQLLGLEPGELQAVRAEHTPAGTREPPAPAGFSRNS